MDTLTDLAPGISPYSYAYDNPINFNDPDGLWPDWLDRFFENLKHRRQQRRECRHKPYDAALGRFMVQDAYAEKYIDLSPT